MNGFLHFIGLCFSPEQTRLSVVHTAEDAGVNIQTFGAIGEGILTSEVILICNEDMAEIPAVFLAYRAVMQDGGLASGWNGVGMLQKLSMHFLTDSQLSWLDFYCHHFILCNSKILSTDIIPGCKITMWNIQSEDFVDRKLL